MATLERLSLYGTMSRPLAGGMSLAVVSGFFPERWMHTYSGIWTLFLGGAILFAVLSIVSSILIYILFFSKGRKEFSLRQAHSVWLKTAIDVVLAALLLGCLMLVELGSTYLTGQNFDRAKYFVTLPILMMAWVAANIAIRLTIRLLLRSFSRTEPQL